jgi:hypothetical protein
VEVNDLVFSAVADEDDECTVVGGHGIVDEDGNARVKLLLHPDKKKTKAEDVRLLVSSPDIQFQF